MLLAVVALPIGLIVALAMWLGRTARRPGGGSTGTGVADGGGWHFWGWGGDRPGEDREAGDSAGSADFGTDSGGGDSGGDDGGGGGD
jgi:hypothetical protein